MSVPELKAFFGLTFLTGYVKKPNLELYWSVDEVDATPYFSQDWEEGRRASRAPYNWDPESRLDGQIGKHNLQHLTPTSRKSRPGRRCRVCKCRGSAARLTCGVNPAVSPCMQENVTQLTTLS